MMKIIRNMLQAINDYSITVSQEFANEFWKKELTQVVYELYPDIMEGLKRLNMKVRSTEYYYINIIITSLGTQYL